jgi:hypothetical protein
MIALEAFKSDTDSVITCFEGIIRNGGMNESGIITITVDAAIKRAVYWISWNSEYGSQSEMTYIAKAYIGRGYVTHNIARVARQYFTSCESTENIP